MARSTPALAIGEITVRQRDGLFSLNDLHKAGGGNPSHRPGNFLQIDQTKALVAEIETAEIPAVSTREGRNGGTYVSRELVIAYAAWINAAFHLKVLRAFLSAAPSPKTAASPKAKAAQPLLPGERGAGTMLLNPSERELIEMLRWTTYAGRDVVRETARIMRMRCPWVQGGDMDKNTARAKGVQVQVSMG